MVSAVVYTVVNSQDEYATIRAVSANVIITDVVLKNSDDMPTTGAVFQQSFSLTFADVGSASTPSSSNGNLVKR